MFVLAAGEGAEEFDQGVGWSRADWQRAAERAFTALGEQWRDGPDRDRLLLVGCLRQGLRLADAHRLELGWLTDAAWAYIGDSVWEPIAPPDTGDRLDTAASSTPRTVKRISPCRWYGQSPKGFSHKRLGPWKQEARQLTPPSLRRSLCVATGVGRLPVRLHRRSPAGQPPQPSPFRPRLAASTDAAHAMTTTLSSRHAPTQTPWTKRQGRDGRIHPDRGHGTRRMPGRPGRTAGAQAWASLD
ncbi:hypothetical protein AB0L59_26265 [Streptomyces sp. NPDC052109]|uniref:hypothetical protein n=1 Tax=Streptomyces sp. NPDC052109 TaxID=3155527 RepID=UPI003423A42E